MEGATSGQGILEQTQRHAGAGAEDLEINGIYRSIRPGGILCGERIIQVYEGILCLCMAIQCSMHSEYTEMNCEDKEMSDALCIVKGKYRLCLTWIVKKTSLNLR